MALPVKQQPPASHKYSIGTTFLKNFKGYGVWEGKIASFDGNFYEVLYPDDGHIERLACPAMDAIMKRSEKLIHQNVRVARRETDMKIEQVHTKGETYDNEESDSSQGPFHTGQHVWIVMGNNKQPAVIHSIGKMGSDDNFTPVVRIEWSMTNLFQDVAMSMVLPMFEDMDGKTVTSSHSKRVRKRTDAYAPSSKKVAVKNGKGSKRELKDEESPLDRNGESVTSAHSSKRVKGSSSVRDKHELNEKEPARGVIMPKKISSSSGSTTASKDQPLNKKPECYYYHEGFKFIYNDTCVAKQEDNYRCSHRLSTGCLVKLKLNRISGVATTYTIDDGPVEHTEGCKCRNRVAEKKRKKEISTKIVTKLTATKAKHSKVKKSKRIHHHEGFKFSLSNSRVRTGDDIYRCCQYHSAKCPVKLAVNRKTGIVRAYTSNNEPVEHAETCQNINGTKEKIMPKEKSKVLASKDGASKKKSKRNYHHEGFKFHFHFSPVLKPEDLYHCCYRIRGNCPMKLRLNRETGTAVPYTSNDDPLEHTEMCRPIHGKINTSSTGEAVEERVASVGERPTASKDRASEMISKGNYPHEGFKFSPTNGKIKTSSTGVAVEERAVTKAKHPKTHTTKRIFHHEGFKFYLARSRVLTSEDIYRCCQSHSAKCRVKLAVSHKTGKVTAYTSNNEPVEHSEICRLRNGKIPTSSMDESVEEKAVSKAKHSKTHTPKRICHLEGFKYYFHYSHRRKPEDVYHCCYRIAGNCPMKLSVNRETGMVVPYTTNDDPLEHTEMCRPIHGKADTSSTEEAVEERDASTGEGMTAKSQKQHHVAAKRESAIRGQKMRRDKAADSTLYKDDHLEQQQVEGDSLFDNGKPRQFKEGQHVWVSIGKAKHPAIIVSIQNGMARVKWTTTNTNGNVEVKQLLPMFEEENGLCYASSFSKRKRTETSRFSPLVLPVKKAKVQEIPKGEEVVGPKGRRGSCKATVVARKTEANEKDSEFIRENLNSYEKVPSGVAPGPGWNLMRVSCNKLKSIQWASPREGIIFKTPRAAFEFEHIRQQCSGDEKQALELYMQQKEAAGERTYIVNRGLLRKRSQGKSIRENLDHNTQVPSGVAPGPGWNSHNSRTYGRSRTHWISPSEGFIFRAPRAAFEFERIRQQCNGNEKQALKLYKKQKKAAGEKHHFIKAKANEESSDSIRGKLGCYAKCPSGVAPGPGWKSLKVRACGRSSTRWVSPREGLVFKFPRVAFEFEKIRQQCNGDEVQALELYKKERKAAGKKHFVMNDIHSRKVVRREGTNKTPTSDKLLSVESESDVQTEEDTESVDSKENMTISEIELQSMVPESSAETEEDTESLDSNEDVTIAEMEYRTLWDYYLKPTTRENEELPSGMILRRKMASCNLLRYKNSVFRQKVHGKILRLERLGKKDEIHRILKDLSDHDKGMKSGDGPSQLMEEILGQQKVDGEIEVLDASAVAAMQDRYGKNEQNCEGLLESNNDMAERNDMVDIEDQTFKSLGISTDLDQSAGNSSMPVWMGYNDYPPPAIAERKDSNDTGEVDADDMDCASLIANEFINDKFIDLCEDSDLDQLSLLPDPPPAFVGHNASNNTTEEEVNAMDSVTELVKEFIESEFTDLCKDGDLDQASLLSDPIHLQQAVQSICEGGQVVSSPSEMYRDLIIFFEDNDLDEAPINAQLVDEPNHQKQTVQDVLQEWTDGETTMSSPITSPTKETDHVHTGVGSDEQMSKKDIPKKVSLDCATEDPDSFNIRATNHEVAAKKHGPQQAEVGGTGSPPKIRKYVVDLCDDDDDDHDCDQIVMPALSEITQERDDHRLVGHGVSQESIGDETTVDSSMASSAADGSQGRTENCHKQKISNEVSSGNTTDEIHNCVNSSQESNQANRQNQKVIDLSQE